MSTQPDTSSKPFLEAARRYFDAGHAPIPLHGKNPLTKGWQAARADELQLARWERRYADANVGLVCGLSNLLVVDIDPRNMEKVASLEELAERHDLPLDAVVQTGPGRR